MVESFKSHKFYQKLRLTTPENYNFVFNQALKIGGKYFTILYRANDMAHARLGLIVSKKNVRRSVDRNRIKRIVREGFRRIHTDISGFDFIVIGRRYVDQYPNTDLCKALVKQWKRLEYSKNHC